MPSVARASQCLAPDAGRAGPAVDPPPDRGSDAVHRPLLDREQVRVQRLAAVVHLGGQAGMVARPAIR